MPGGILDDALNSMMQARQMKQSMMMQQATLAYHQYMGQLAGQRAADMEAYHQAYINNQQQKTAQEGKQFQEGLGIKQKALDMQGNSLKERVRHDTTMEGNQLSVARTRAAGPLMGSLLGQGATPFQAQQLANGVLGGPPVAPQLIPGTPAAAPVMPATGAASMTPAQANGLGMDPNKPLPLVAARLKNYTTIGKVDEERLAIQKQQLADTRRLFDLKSKLVDAQIQNYSSMAHSRAVEDSVKLETLGISKEKAQAYAANVGSMIQARNFAQKGDVIKARTSMIGGIRGWVNTISTVNSHIANVDRQYHTLNTEKGFWQGIKDNMGDNDVWTDPSTNKQYSRQQVADAMGQVDNTLASLKNVSDGLNHTLSNAQGFLKQSVQFMEDGGYVPPIRSVSGHPISHANATAALNAMAGAGAPRRTPSLAGPPERPVHPVAVQGIDQYKKSIYHGLNPKQQQVLNSLLGIDK